VIGGELAITESGCDEFHVFITGSLRFGLGAGKHAWLDIKRNNATGRADASDQRNCQTSRPAPGIQHRHAIGELMGFDNERSAVCLGEWVIQFYKPTQPNRTGKTLTTRSQAPYGCHKYYNTDEYKEND
jgi:hypothetical protein